MTARTRKIIALLFLLGFVLTAPLVILTTKGYRYNWKKGRLEKTGILVLDSLPTEADIYLNGSLYRKKTPTSLFRMLPESYAIRLQKTGYLPWQKVLPIKSGETTFTQEVILFQDVVPQLLEAGDFTAAAFDPTGRRAALLRRGDEWLELVIYDRRTAVTSVLDRFSPDKYASPELSWSPDGGRLLFQAKVAGGERELLIYTAGGAETGALPVNLPPEGWRKAAWSDDGTALIILSDRGLFTAAPDGGDPITVILSPRIQDAAAVGRNAYLLETEADKVVLERMNLDGRGLPETVADLPAGKYSVSDANERYLLLTDAGGASRLIDRQNGRIAATVNARHAAWEKTPGEGRLLLWNDFELYVLDPAAGTPQLITRLGTALTGAAWHVSGRDVIYGTADSVSAIELDDRDQRNAFELARLTGIRGFLADPSTATLLLIGSAGNSKGIFERGL